MTAEISPTGTLLQTWASNTTIVPPSQTKIDGGWESGERPSHLTWNWLENTLGQKINHILSYGVALWDTATIYTEGALVNYDNETYRSLIPNNLANVPDTNPTEWELITSASPTGEFAARDLSNVSASDMLDKFENTGTSTWSYNGTSEKLRAENANNLYFLDSSYTILPEDNGKTIYVRGESVSSVLTLPLTTSIEDNFNVKIIINTEIDSGVLITPQGTDTIQYDGENNTDSLRFDKNTINTEIRISKIAGVSTYVASGTPEYTQQIENYKEGFAYLGGNVVMQWGTATVSQASGLIPSANEIVLPLPFLNTSYAVNITFKDFESGVDNNIIATFLPIDNTKFNIYNYYNASENTVTWTAIGFIDSLRG